MTDHLEPAQWIEWAAAEIEALRTQRGIISDDRFRYRATMEQLIQVIRQNLGTHDHTDWCLESLVDAAEKSLEDKPDYHKDALERIVLESWKPNALVHDLANIASEALGKAHNRDFTVDEQGYFNFKPAADEAVQK